MRIAQACPLCEHRVSHRRRHLFQQHLPTSIHPWSNADPAQVAQQLDSYLVALSRATGSNTPARLYELARERLFLLDVEELSCIAGTQEIVDILLEGQDYRSFRRNPDQLYHLIHEVVLVRLLTLVSPADRQRLRGEPSLHPRPYSLLVPPSSQPTPRQPTPSTPRERQSFLSQRHRSRSPLRREESSDQDISRVRRTSTSAHPRDSRTVTIQSVVPRPSRNPHPDRSAIVAIDAHCHVQRLLRTLHLDDLTGIETHNPESAHLYMGLAMIDNSIDPGAANHLTPWRRVNSTMVLHTVGCHPKKVREMTEEKWAAMERAIQDRRVVGVGETGFDESYSHHETQQHQLTAFRQHVRFADRYRKPLILHYKGGSVARFIHVLRTEVPADTYMLWHCFGAEAITQTQAILLTGLFPKLYFGVGTVLLGVKGPEKAQQLRQLLRIMPRHRLVLESDAPHLAIENQAINYPTIIWRVAEALATAFSLTETVPVMEIIDLTRQAALRLYNL